MKTMACDVSLFYQILQLLCLLMVGLCSHKDQVIVTQSLDIRDYWFFQIVEPAEISYMYKIKPAKDFGTDMNQSIAGVELVMAEPLHACSRIMNHFFVKHNVVLAERGECSFLTKTIHAQEAGAAAIIIKDYDKDDNRMIDMIHDETERTAEIPAFFMLGKDGHMIQKTLEELNLRSAIINIPINTTGVPAHLLNMPPWSLW